MTEQGIESKRLYEGAEKFREYLYERENAEATIRKYMTELLRA